MQKYIEREIGEMQHYANNVQKALEEYSAALKNCTDVFSQMATIGTLKRIIDRQHMLMECHLTAFSSLEKAKQEIEASNN